MHMCSGVTLVKDVCTIFRLHLTRCGSFFLFFSPSPLHACLSCEQLSGASRLVLYSVGRMTHLSVIQFTRDIVLVHPAVLSSPSTCQKQTVSLNKLLPPIHEGLVLQHRPVMFLR